MYSALYLENKPPFLAFAICMLVSHSNPSGYTWLQSVCPYMIILCAKNAITELQKSVIKVAGLNCYNELIPSVMPTVCNSSLKKLFNVKKESVPLRVFDTVFQYSSHDNWKSNWFQSTIWRGDKLIEFPLRASKRFPICDVELSWFAFIFKLAAP